MYYTGKRTAGNTKEYTIPAPFVNAVKTALKGEITALYTGDLVLEKNESWAELLEKNESTTQ